MITATAPADFTPVAQDEGQPVRAGKASDEVPVRGVGLGTHTGQSDEFVAVREAGEGGRTLGDPALLPNDLVGRSS